MGCPVMAQQGSTGVRRIHTPMGPVLRMILVLATVLAARAGSPEHSDLIRSIGELRSLRAQVEDQVRRVKSSGRSDSDDYRTAQAAYKKAADLHNYLLDAIAHSLLHGGDNTEVTTSLYGFDRALVGATRSLHLGKEPVRSVAADQTNASAQEVDTITSAPLLHLLFAGVTLKHQGATLKGLEQAAKDLHWASWENVR